ncbi:uncharacterized protein [Clytia hemisphaerica]|uniref:uncharacterized protein n=1 Tax=Clytia hemisphaerica TaxID=252671 RepID=UPI0034D77F97
MSSIGVTGGFKTIEQTFYKWNIGTINVRTCKDDLKLERVVQEIHKANLEISAIQEVRRLKQGSATVKCDNSKYEIYWSGHSLKRQHGVGFVIKVDPNVEIVQVEYVDARIIVLQTKVYGCLLKVINCYAPTEESSDSSKDLFYRNLNKQFVNVPTKYKVICLGDFNATTSAACDHRLVIANIKSPGNKLSRAKRRKPKTKHKKLNYDLLDTEEVRETLISNFNNSWENIQINNLDNDEINDLIIKTIETTATETLPETIKQKLHQPWQNDEKLKELYTKKDELVKRNADQKPLQQLRKKIRKRSRQLRNEHFKTEALKLNTLAAMRELDKLFATAKRQTTTLNTSTASMCPPDKISKHFKQHFNPEKENTVRPDELDNLPSFVESLLKISSTIDINIEPPTIDEITKHLQKLKNKKANNDIDSELLKKYECPALLDAICKMTLNVWENLDIPSAWGNSRLKTLWKGKGSKKDPTKYRGLSIGSTISKLIVNIILSADSNLGTRHN